MYIIEPERQLPVYDEYDVLVCGGGIAGISAALAASRHGAKVLLVEREYLLGGLATLGLVTTYLPLCDGKGHQVIFGIPEELLRLSIRNGIEDMYCPEWLEGGTVKERSERRFEIRYNPQIFAIEIEQLLQNQGIKILFGTNVCAVRKQENRITHVIIENKSGRSAISVNSVIDTTGDADVCYFAEESTVTFQRGNIPAAWYYYIENNSYCLKELGFSEKLETEKLKERIAQKRILGIDAYELTQYVMYSRKMVLNDFLEKEKNSPKHALSTLATIPQVRMTRRLQGVYTQDENTKHRKLDDSVGLFGNWRKRGPVYELSFRALYGKNVKNLITAGRCISVTDIMWDITRVIPVCSVSGQAAGTAASFCSNFEKIDMNYLQQLLKNDGVILHEKL
ncbi:FAD-dependent oxidoreductase [Ructibacterium gallinarum]|uniref:FAD-dependent oxidoreductase n=1 Tax=Ructibacterium gallinarum TaxID=2779355 RepID=A0A9D5M1H7_9FIRM|nr:FAD-dependent oxidoreductase [Ructibacterium gallinarum]MBE5040897.1 FAD-dependent oxidoreductase [Ructibacterium gallinarum]